VKYKVKHYNKNSFENLLDLVYVYLETTIFSVEISTITITSSTNNYDKYHNYVLGKMINVILPDEEFLYHGSPQINDDFIIELQIQYIDGSTTAKTYK